MYRNYENRVKDFVIDMTNPHSMIEHKDITEKITNTRVELMNELFANNPEKKRPLVFRGYITEADRIKDTVKNNRFLYYLPDYEKIKKERKKLKASSSPKNDSKISKYPKALKLNSLEKKESNANKKLINKKFQIFSPTRTLIHHQTLNKQLNEKKNMNYLISQPTMRYKPRTDLERVYDALNDYNLDEKSRDIIERQLKSINLYDYKKSGDLTSNSDKKENDNYYKNYNSKSLTSKNLRNGKKKKKFDLYKSNKIYYNPKNDEFKPWQRRDDLNNEAYGLLSSYHYKTHFKAAEEIAESNYKYDKNNKNKNSVFLLPNLLPSQYKPKPIKTEADSEEKEDPFKFGEDEYSDEQSEDYEEFDKNYNPIIQKTKTVSDPETMRILTKIAFKPKKSSYDTFDFKNEEDDEKNILLKNKNKKGNKNYSEDNNVIIKNKLYYKNSQFDKITNEILSMCNVHSPKSKFNNTVHKAKGGKTMITNGMTVREFEKKYRIEE